MDYRLLIKIIKGLCPPMFIGEPVRPPMVIGGIGRIMPKEKSLAAKKQKSHKNAKEEKSTIAKVQKKPQKLQKKIISSKVQVKQKPSLSKKKYFYAIGRRKSAEAQVRLYSGEGEIIINKKLYKEYFPTFSLQRIICQPLLLVGTEKKFGMEVKTKGGGKRSQAEATRLGVSRALLNFDQGLKKTLKKAGFLTRDPREKERKKYGYRGARRGRQFRKR